MKPWAEKNILLSLTVCNSLIEPQWISRVAYLTTASFIYFDVSAKKKNSTLAYHLKDAKEEMRNGGLLSGNCVIRKSGVFVESQIFYGPDILPRSVKNFVLLARCQSERRLLKGRPNPWDGLMGVPKC